MEGTRSINGVFRKINFLFTKTPQRVDVLNSLINCHLFPSYILNIMYMSGIMFRSEDTRYWGITHNKKKKFLTLTEATVFFWGKPTSNITYKIDDNSCDCQEAELSDPRSSEVPFIFVTGFLSFCVLIPPSGVPSICPLPFCFSPLEPSTWLMISLYSFCSHDTSPRRGVLSSF